MPSWYEWRLLQLLILMKVIDVSFQIRFVQQIRQDFNSQDFELIFSTVHVSAVYIALQSSYWVNQINWTCAACLK